MVPLQINIEKIIASLILTNHDRILRVDVWVRKDYYTHAHTLKRIFYITTIIIRNQMKINRKFLYWYFNNIKFISPKSYFSMIISLDRRKNKYTKRFFLKKNYSNYLLPYRRVSQTAVAAILRKDASPVLPILFFSTQENDKKSNYSIRQVKHWQSFSIYFCTTMNTSLQK